MIGLENVNLVIHLDPGKRLCSERATEYSPGLGAEARSSGVEAAYPGLSPPHDPSALKGQPKPVANSA